MTFFVAGIPKPKGSFRSVGRGRFIPDCAATKNWQRAVENAAFAEMNRSGKPGKGPIRLDCTFWLPRPKSAKVFIPSVKPDLDKLLRAVFDALENSGVIENDSRIVRISASKAYAEIEKVTAGALICLTNGV